MRISSIRDKKRKNGFNTTPVFEKGTGQPATLCRHNIGIGTLQKEFRGTTYTKSVPRHLREASSNPYHVTTIDKPWLRHRRPTPISSLEGKERCGVGNKRIGG
jgi:hypothetical protein